MYTTIRPKIRVLINLIFLFAHNHSTKVRGHSYSLIYHCPSCANISFAVFMADTALIIFLFQVVLLLRFVWANSWQYHCYIFRTMYSWWPLLLYFVRYVHGYMKSHPVPGAQVAPTACGILQLVVSLNVAITLAVPLGVLGNLIKYFQRR